MIKDEQTSERLADAMDAQMLKAPDTGFRVEHRYGDEPEAQAEVRGGPPAETEAGGRAGQDVVGRTWGESSGGDRATLEGVPGVRLGESWEEGAGAAHVAIDLGVEGEVEGGSGRRPAAAAEIDGAPAAAAPKAAAAEAEAEQKGDGAGVSSSARAPAWYQVGSRWHVCPFYPCQGQQIP